MNTYKRHRFPSVIIQYAVWLYYRFNLSRRDVSDHSLRICWLGVALLSATNLSGYGASSLAGDMLGD